MRHSLTKGAGSDDLLALLGECHERIRAFTDLAVEASRPEPTDADVAEACARCLRYFDEALPLHVADEEESVFPRLAGLSGDVDGALAAMHAQHLSHRPHVDDLAAALAALRDAPADPWRRNYLGTVASQLQDHFDEHLALEEAVLFPLIASSMTAAVQADVVRELRARRQPSR